MKKQNGSSLWRFLSLPVVCSIGMGLTGLPGYAQSQGDNTTSRSGGAARRGESAFRLRFANTDVSDVLQALSLKTKASIVFPSQIKKPISVDITASTTEEALRFITAAAGLAYHQVGKTYIVALPTELRQAIEPFGSRATISLASIQPVDAAKLLESALPCLTARPMGKQVLAIGDPEDIKQARILLESQDRPALDVSTTAELVSVQYANPAQLAALVKSMYDGVKAEAVMQPNRPGGSIGITGTREQLVAAKNTIRSLDLRGNAADPEKVFRVYQIRHSSAPALLDFISKAAPGVTALMAPETYSPKKPNFAPLSSASFGGSSGGSSGGSGSGGSSGGSSGGGGGQSSDQNGAGGVRAGDHSTAIVLTGADADVSAAASLLAQVDVAPKQVMVEVKVVDTSPEAAEQIGAQWSFDPLSFFETRKNTDIGAGGYASTTKSPGIGQFSRLPWGFNATIDAMVTRREAKILASPKVMVIDNEDANIFIGDTIRTRISQASTNGTTIQVLEFPIGIVLLVRPRVNADGKITMRVHPVVSTITGIGADNLPQTSSREADTTVMIKDGETIVLGGLIRDEMLKTVQEVPILSKLPIVGELFRFHAKNHRHSEIMVFITPHILDDNGRIVQAEVKPQGAVVDIVPASPAKQAKVKGASHGN